MDDQNNITPINPAPSQAPGAPSNLSGPTASEQPASPMPGDPQAAISSYPGEISNADRIAKLEADLAIMARMVLDATLADGIEGGTAALLDNRIADLEARNEVIELLGDGQSGDMAAQVHAITAHVRGIAQKVGYVHKQARGA